MVVQDKQLDVSVHGAVETQAFTIKTSAKAFQILSEGLYGNRHGAVIRELACNASDAHVDAGCPDEPFHIKMPNSIDPTFKIRDHGTGLSDKDMHQIYTTFFESTKTGSNDFVGALGLGSKSFFAVADSANITSYFNGTRTVYIAYLDENRIPSLSTFSSMPTDEPNGLEVEVAIKKDETKYFRDEVNNQLKYFKVKPTISGDSQFKWDLEEEYVYEGTNGEWKMVGAGRYDTIRAVQGQVAYPIQVHNMGARAEMADPVLKALLDTNLLLTFNIGEININPSRETLSYDDATVNNIMAKAAVVLEELPTQIAKRFDDVETEWEARLLYSSICNSLGGRTTLLNKIQETGIIKWKGMDISSLHIKVPGKAFNNYHSFSKSGFKKWKKDNKRLKNVTYEDANPHWEFQVQKNKVIVYANANDKAVDARTKQYCTDNSISSVHIITSTSTEDTFEEIRTALGHPEMLRASTFEKVRRVKSNTPSDKSIYVQVYTDGWNKSDRWSRVESVTDMSELEGIYIDLDRVSAMIGGEEIKDFNRVMNVLNDLDLIGDKTLYGLRPRNRKLSHNLEHITDYVTRKLKEKEINTHMFNREVFGGHIQEDNSLRKKILEEIPKSSDFYKITKAINDNTNNKFGSKAQSRLRSIGVQIKGEDMSELTEKVHDKYFMVKGSRYRCSDDQIINYCKQMDKLEELGL